MPEREPPCHFQPVSQPGVRNKWYGGIRAEDGSIWGMPFNAPSVLKIVPETGAVREVGGLPSGGYKWHGGARCGEYLVGIPSHALSVLLVHTPSETITLVEHGIPGGYKWGGGAVGLDGNVYGMPSDTDSVLRIRCATEEVDTIGDGLLPDIKNKWQGGVLAPDGAIYAIPSDADSVLKVVPETATVSLVGQLSDDPDKWQGGFLGADGIIYGIPENADKILRIIPPENDEGMARVVAAAAASGAASVGKMDGYGKGKGDKKEEKVVRKEKEERRKKGLFYAQVTANINELEKHGITFKLQRRILIVQSGPLQKPSPHTRQLYFLQMYKKIIIVNALKVYLIGPYSSTRTCKHICLRT